MRVEFPVLCLPDAEYVALHLRPADAMEVYAGRDDDNPVTLAKDTVEAAVAGAGWACRLDGLPVAVVGVTPFPDDPERVLQAWAFGTGRWPDAVRPLTRFILGHVRPLLYRTPFQRMQADSHVRHVEAHRWMRALGAVPGCVLPGRGRDGADFIRYVWTR